MLQTETAAKVIEPGTKNEDVQVRKETGKGIELTNEGRQEPISKVFSDKNASLAEFAEQDLRQDEDKEKLKYQPPDTPVECSEDIFKEIEMDGFSKEATVQIPIPGEVHEDNLEEPDNSDEPKGSLTVNTYAEDTELTVIGGVEISDNRFIGTVPSTENVQRFEFSPKPEKLVFHLGIPDSDVQKTTPGVEGFQSDAEHHQGEDLVPKEQDLTFESNTERQRDDVKIKEGEEVEILKEDRKETPRYYDRDKVPSEETERRITGQKIKIERPEAEDVVVNDDTLTKSDSEHPRYEHSKVAEVSAGVETVKETNRRGTD